jgi:threonyl-tRNA synthetase
LSTHERFIGFLIEHYGGDFPLWLSPIQVIILPVSEKTHTYATSVQSKFKAAGIRVKMDDRPEKIGAKIRRAELNKIPVMAIVGKKEAEQNTVSTRRRFIGDQGAIKTDQLLKNIISEIKQRSLPHRES